MCRGIRSAGSRLCGWNRDERRQYRLCGKGMARAPVVLRFRQGGAASGSLVDSALPGGCALSPNVARSSSRSLLALGLLVGLAVNISICLLLNSLYDGFPLL